MLMKLRSIGWCDFLLSYNFFCRCHDYTNGCDIYSESEGCVAIPRSVY